MNDKSIWGGCLFWIGLCGVQIMFAVIFYHFFGDYGGFVMLIALLVFLHFLSKFFKK